MDVVNLPHKDRACFRVCQEQLPGEQAGLRMAWDTPGTSPPARQRVHLAQVHVCHPSLGRRPTPSLTTHLWPGSGGKAGQGPALPIQ